MHIGIMLQSQMQFQLGHFFSEMDRAAILGPLLLSEKSRFTSIPLTIQSFYER